MVKANELIDRLILIKDGLDDSDKDVINEVCRILENFNANFEKMNIKLKSKKKSDPRVRIQNWLDDMQAYLNKTEGDNY